MLLAVKLNKYPNRVTHLKITTPTEKIKTNDYIKIQNKKYYIKTPDSDTNYRLYNNNTYNKSDMFHVLAQGSLFLSITNDILTNSYINDIINYGLSLRGIEYGYWGGNEPEIGEPMWAMNDPPPFTQ